MWKQIFEERLEVSTVKIERAHRVGRKSEKSRTIVLKLLDYNDKERILRKTKLLKNTGVYINEDFCNETVEKRKNLWKQVIEHRKNGKFAKIMYDRIIVNEFKSRSNTGKDLDRTL